MNTTQPSFTLVKSTKQKNPSYTVVRRYLRRTILYNKSKINIHTHWRRPPPTEQHPENAQWHSAVSRQRFDPVMTLITAMCFKHSLCVNVDSIVDRQNRLGQAKLHTAVSHPPVPLYKRRRLTIVYCTVYTDTPKVKDTQSQDTTWTNNNTK